MNTTKAKWIKVKKGDAFPEDVFFATKEDLENGCIGNIMYSKGCKANEDGYYLSHKAVAELPIEN